MSQENSILGSREYLRKARQLPLLSAEEELELSEQFQVTGNPSLLEKLINHHMKLVIKIASGYKGYGISQEDLISEGVIGLIQAATKFDPSLGYRLSTYSQWWIKAAIQDYILRSWSLVKLGTTKNQKKLFFSLRKTKAELSLMNDGYLSPQDVENLAEVLDVKPEEVEDMNHRLMGNDFSLNAEITTSEGNHEWQDWLEDEEDVENKIILADEQKKNSKLLDYAMRFLNEKELTVIKERTLKEVPKTLQELSEQLGISKERVRQLEESAILKLKGAIRRKQKEDQMAANFC